MELMEESIVRAALAWVVCHYGTKTEQGTLAGNSNYLGVVVWPDTIGSSVQCHSFYIDQETSILELIGKLSQCIISA